MTKEELLIVFRTIPTDICFAWCYQCGAYRHNYLKRRQKPTGIGGPNPAAATSAKSETYKCESCGKQYRDEQLLTHRCTKGAKR